MVYDFEFYSNRPSYYARPPIYTSGYRNRWADSLYNYYKYYTPYRYSSYSTYSSPYSSAYYSYPYYGSYLPYRHWTDYSPLYSYNKYVSPVSTGYYGLTEAQKYQLKYGLDFDATTREIRDSATRLLKEVHQNVSRAPSVSRFVRELSVPHFVRESSVPLFTRASSLQPSYGRYDSDIDDEISYYKSRASQFRKEASERRYTALRTLSEEPSLYSRQSLAR